MEFISKPAFPTKHGDAGMTLRDYFAAKSMQSLVSDPMFLDASGDTVESVAKAAYIVADAMLIERNKGDLHEKQR